MGLDPLSQTTTITFKSLYAVKVTASIAFGLLTEPLKNTDSTTAGWKQGSLGLWSTNGGRYEQDYGNIWVDGKQVGNSSKDLFLAENGRLSMTVDIPSRSVTFSINGNQVAKIQNVEWLQAGKVYVVCIVQL